MPIDCFGCPQMEEWGKEDIVWLISSQWTRSNSYMVRISWIKRYSWMLHQLRQKLTKEWGSNVFFDWGFSTTK